MSTRDRIAATLITHPAMSDRQIAARLKHRYWSDVRDVRQALAPANAAAPVPRPTPIPARPTPHEEALSAALVRMIQREPDKAERYHLRLALVRVRYRPYTPTTGKG